MRFPKFFFIIYLITFLVPCHAVYQIGRDPTWDPLNFKQRTTNVNFFINSFFNDLNKKTPNTLFLVDDCSSLIFRNLQNGNFQGILTTLDPTPNNKKFYNFSNPIITLGPVLVVKKNSSISSLDDLQGKVLGISPYNNSILIAQKVPRIIIKNYRSMGRAIVDLDRGCLDGVLIDIMEAKSFLESGPFSDLTIATPPLNDRGIRLITLKGQNKKLISLVNSQLKNYRNFYD
jgi:polar amino acid transport system substrate-binding protein